MLRTLRQLAARPLLKDESGQTTVLAVGGMILVIAFLGLAVDVGNLRYAKRKLQTAADAAAIAAGLEVRVCASQTPCQLMVDAAKSALAENGYTDVSVANNCGTPGAADVQLTLNTPPCTLGASDPNAGKTALVEVALNHSEPTYFARILGFGTVALSARAEAGKPQHPPCIWALDPSGSGAISILAGLGVSAKCGMVDESSSNSALTCLVGLGLSTPSIAIHGGAAGLLCATNSQVTTNAPVPSPADPLGYLTKPTVGACGAKSGGEWYGSATAVNILLGGNYVFHPGVYCGGISMTATLLANITFMPGTYILTNGPGLLGIQQGGLNLTLSLLSNIQGTGVTFYNTGSVGSISITAPATLGLSNFNFSAPTSGPYAGVLFFQDPADTATGTFLVSLAQGSKMDGAIYLPGASVSYGVGAISSNYTILVAKDINFNVAILSTFGNDYSTLTNGSPLHQDAAVLFQ